MVKYRTMDDMLLKPSHQSPISIPSLHDILILSIFEGIFFLLY